MLLDKSLYGDSPNESPASPLPEEEATLTLLPCSAASVLAGAIANVR